MVKCEEGYLCSVCGGDVESITDSDLYLRFVAGLVDAEVLHTTPERHIRCNPVVAQFIIHEDFEPVDYEGPFSAGQLDTAFVAARTDLLTRAWCRLRLLPESKCPVHEYPLPEVVARFRLETQETGLDKNDLG